jgi:hypothetical protein
MVEAGIVHEVSGDFNPALRQVRLRVQAEKLDHPHDFLIPAEDIQALVILLLQLSAKLGGPNSDVRQTLPLNPDSLGIGETEDGSFVLHLDVGETTLAFNLPPHMSRRLGYALITVSAAAEGGAAN